jgi:hypothetical protein
LAVVLWLLVLVAFPPFVPLPPAVLELRVPVAVALLLAPFPADALLLPETVPPLASEETQTTVVTVCLASTVPLSLLASTALPLPATTPTLDVPPLASMGPVVAVLATSFFAVVFWLLSLEALPPPLPPDVPVPPDVFEVRTAVESAVVGADAVSAFATA